MDKVSNRRQLTLQKKLLFSTLIVGAFFAIVELGLWAAGTPTVIELEDPFRGFSGLVDVFELNGDQFQTRKTALNSFNDQSFLAEKPATGLRIFCMGGSSAHGFPWGAEAAFTSVLGELISAKHQELQVEAINASGVSYAMHRLNIVADELLHYDPDIFVIYSGHNEFIEPVFMEALKGRNRTLTQIEYVAAHSRIYSGIRNAVQRPPEPASKLDNLSTTVVREHGVFTTDEKREIVAEFRSRLDRLVRRAKAAGVKVVLTTVPCNERDWSPELSGNVAALSDESRQAWSAAFGMGKSLLQRDEYEFANEQLKNAAKIAPQHAETQYLLGKALDQLGQWDAARTAYRNAVDADNSPIRRLSGINDAVREVADQHNCLLVDIDKVFEEKSEHGLVGFNLIKDYVHPTRKGHELIAWHIWDAIERAGWLGTTSSAEKDVFEQVVANRPEVTNTSNAVWFFNQGVLLQKQGAIEEAIANYRDAIRIQSNYVAAMCNLGELLVTVGRPDESARVMERAVALNPNEPGVHNNLAGALQQLGRFEDAIKHYKLELAQNGPDQASVHRNLGLSLQSLGRLSEAGQHYELAIQIEPDNAVAHTYWGSLLLQQKKQDEAQTHFAQAVQLDPDNAENYSNLGVVLMRARKYEDAIANYRRAIQIRPDYAVAYKNLGLAFAQSGNIREAAVQFQKALDLQPNLPGLRDNLQRAQMLLQQQSRP